VRTLLLTQLGHHILQQQSQQEMPSLVVTVPFN
jgi:hypothetical protein